MSSFAQNARVPDAGSPSLHSRFTGWFAKAALSFRRAEPDARIVTIMMGLGFMVAVLAIAALPAVYFYPGMSLLAIALTGAAGVLMIRVAGAYWTASRGAVYPRSPVYWWLCALVHGFMNIQSWGIFGALLYILAYVIRP